MSYTNILPNKEGRTFTQGALHQCFMQHAEIMSYF